MWRLATRPQVHLPGLAEFIAVVSTSDMFSAHSPIYIGRAPGRLDLMGGIADYSGSLVLELPLEAAAFAAVQLVEDPTLTVHSCNADELGTAKASVSLEVRALLGGYPEVRDLLGADPEAHWAAYVAGAVTVLHHEAGISPEGGMRLLLDSRVPPGKGVSSSAAIEVASMQAICNALGLDVPPRQLAIWCQKVENLVVGAPCGVMDQMTAACGQQDELLALLCQPAELQGSVHLPTNVRVWGLDSGIRHAVSGADYTSVRVGAFMGYRIITQMEGLPSRQVGAGRVEVQDDIWRGYLANVPPSIWESRYRDRVPPEMRGEDFLREYAGITDSVTRVDPGRLYAVRQPTAHPIYEHHRVRLFRALLEADPDEETLQLLGELMYQSHASYSACGLGSDGTDLIVEMVREAGPEAGLYGAKITGGGSGGTVAILGTADAEPTVREIAERYARETGREATLISGSSPGAHASKGLRLVRN